MCFFSVSLLISQVDSSFGDLPFPSPPPLLLLFLIGPHVLGPQLFEIQNYLGYQDLNYP